MRTTMWYPQFMKQVDSKRKIFEVVQFHRHSVIFALGNYHRGYVPVWTFPKATIFGNISLCDLGRDTCRGTSLNRSFEMCVLPNETMLCSETIDLLEFLENCGSCRAVVYLFQVSKELADVTRQIVGTRELRLHQYLNNDNGRVYEW